MLGPPRAPGNYESRKRWEDLERNIYGQYLQAIYHPLVDKTCGERAMKYFPIFGVPRDSVETAPGLCDTCQNSMEHQAPTNRSSSRKL
jgi:hypothetical protein